MASFTISGTSTTSQVLIAGETGVITSNGTLATSGNAITINQSGGLGGNDLFIFGTVSSSSGSAILGNDIGGLNLTIGTQGVVTGDNFFEAVIDFNFSLTASNTTQAVISNAGLITGNKPIAIDGADGFQRAKIVNTGSIVGTGLGDAQICILGGSQLESLTITNHGALLTADLSAVIRHESSAGSLVVVNTGTISGPRTAISAANALLVLENTGDIQGQVDFFGGIDLVNAGLINGDILDVVFDDVISKVRNSGRITGNLGLANVSDDVRNTGSIDGNVSLGNGNNTFGNIGGFVGGFLSLGQDADTVRNSGEIASSIFLGAGSNLFQNVGGTVTGDVNSGAGGDTVRNSGRIEGDVNLGDGANVFDGRGGQVLGKVVSGNGDDLFTIDDATIELIAGAGVDTVRTLVGYKIPEGVEVLLGLSDQGLYLRGRGGNEQVTGGAGDDTIEGRGGIDQLNGGAGDDLVKGGAGNDRFEMSRDSDTMEGGDGSDELSAGLLIGTLVVNLGSGTAVVLDGDGEDLGSAKVQNIENARGTNLNDSLTGSGLANLLLGNEGDDLLVGAAGNDTLQGGVGNDILSGGNNDDLLTGGGGSDTLTGGAGGDRFIFLATDDSPQAAPDRITDFNVSLDKIDLSPIDANTEVKADQAFTFIGSAGFSGDGQVRFFQDAVANTTTVQVRVNVFATNMEIVLDGLVNLTAAQFDL